MFVYLGRVLAFVGCGAFCDVAAMLRFILELLTMKLNGGLRCRFVPDLLRLLLLRRVRSLNVARLHHGKAMSGPGTPGLGSLSDAASRPSAVIQTHTNHWYPFVSSTVASHIVAIQQLVPTLQSWQTTVTMVPTLAMIVPTEGTAF